MHASIKPDLCHDVQFNMGSISCVLAKIGILCQCEVHHILFSVSQIATGSECSLDIHLEALGPLPSTNSHRILQACLDWFPIFRQLF